MANWYDSIVGGAQYLAGGIYSALTGAQNYQNYQAPQVTTASQRAAMGTSAPIQSNTPSIPSGQVLGANTGGNGSMTEQEALNKGIDINQLRKQRLLIENTGGSGGSPN